MTSQEMDLIIKHRSEINNTNADALSQNPVYLNLTDINVNSCIVANAQPQDGIPRQSCMNKHEPTQGVSPNPRSMQAVAVVIL